MRKIIKKIVATLAIIPVFSFGVTEAKQLRIGYQKSDPGFILLKNSGELEKKLEPLGVKVTWIEFPAGPQLLEGLNVGSIDLGTVGLIKKNGVWKVKLASILWLFKKDYLQMSVKK